MTDGAKAKLVGINHVALEVGDIEEALAFYDELFEFTLRGKGDGRAFIDLGDQFLALSEAPDAGKGDVPDRHFGLVVDDRAAVLDRLAARGIVLLDGPFCDFLDPWNNRIEIVQYRDLQFTKSPGALAKLGVDPAKSAEAERELREKGL